jgi:hypothetical protein
MLRPHFVFFTTAILKTNTRVGEDLVSSRSGRRQDTRSSPTGDHLRNRCSRSHRSITTLGSRLVRRSA